MTKMVERVQLRSSLVGRIAADPEFAIALEELYEAYIPDLPELPHWSVLSDQVPLAEGPDSGSPAAGNASDPAAYVAAVRTLAARWGLDRLIGRDERGAKLIHDWCRYRRASGLPRPVGWLIHGLIEAEYVAEIGEVVARSETDLGDVRVIDLLVRPVVRIQFEDEWDPQRESRAAARKRLGARADHEIQAELDRLTADAEAKGYRFVDQSPKLKRDLDWLFELMAKGATVEDLAVRTGRGDPVDAEGAVARAVQRIAERAGISAHGWGVTRR